MLHLEESIPKPLMWKTHATVRRYLCHYTGNKTPPCFISLTDIERWYYEEFLPESTVRRPFKNCDNEYVLCTTHATGNNKTCEIQKYEEQRAKEADAMKLTIDDYANRCRKYGNLSLAVMDHLHSLDYVVCPVVCLDHLIRFETIGKIFFVLCSFNYIKNSGYIQLTDAIYQQTLSKLGSVLESYDYSHFYPENQSCNHCTKYDLWEILFYFMYRLDTMTWNVIGRKYCSRFDSVYGKLISVLKSKRNSSGPQGLKDKQTHLMVSGKNFYTIIDIYYEMYFNKPYAPCTIDTHGLALPLKVIYTHSILGRKTYEKTMADLIATSPSDNCDICHESLSAVESVSVSCFCRHIFCGPCINAWKLQNDNK